MAQGLKQSHSGKKKYIAAAILAATAVIAVGGFLFWHRSSSPLPPVIQQQVSFTAYFPGAPWKTDTHDASYQSGVLRFVAQQAQEQVVFTEQSTPPIFSEVPQYLPSLLTKMNQYASFSSPSGTVFLTKPNELRGGQTAVIENAGTLLFIRPAQELSEKQWRQLCSGLYTVK